MGPDEALGNPADFLALGDMPLKILSSSPGILVEATPRVC